MTPRPYQIAGRDFLADRKLALLADEMRVGKTPQAILAAHKVGARSILVLCPAIGVPHWEREFTRWWPEGETPPVVGVMSYDRARLARDLLRSARWDVLIADEAHYAKNPAAARTKLVYGKDGYGTQAKRLWALSGTPAPRHAAELWPMLRAFGATDLSYKEFCGYYCVQEYRLRGKTRELVVVGTQEGKIPELRAMLAPHMLRRTRAQVAPEIPGIQLFVTPVAPTAKLLHEERGVPLGMSDEEAAEWLKDNSKHMGDWRQMVARAKILPLVELINMEVNAGNLRQTVIFGVHVQPLEELTALLNVHGHSARLITGTTPRKTRETYQEMFRKGELRVLVANIIAAGTTIDLSAAHHGYFLELDWVPGDNLQAANRLVSLDKARPVTYDVVTWKGSFDAIIQRALTTRTREIAQLY